MPKALKNKLVKNWSSLWKSYSVMSLLVNLIISISMVGMGAVPLLSDYLTAKQIFIVVGILSFLGILGRTLKQQGIDDD